MLYWSLLVLLVFVLSVVLPYTDTLRYGQYKQNFCYCSAYDVTSFVCVVLLWRGEKKAYMTLCYVHYKDWSIQTFLTLECLWRHILCMCGFVMTQREKGLYDIRRYSLRKLVYWDFSNSVVLMMFMFSNFCYDGDWQNAYMTTKCNWGKPQIQ